MQSRNIAQSGTTVGDPKSMSQYLPKAIIEKMVIIIIKFKKKKKLLKK